MNKFNHLLLLLAVVFYAVHVFHTSAQLFYAVCWQIMYNNEFLCVKSQYATLFYFIVFHVQPSVAHMKGTFPSNFTAAHIPFTSHQSQ